jgi:serine/threonine-protein kinase
MDQPKAVIEVASLADHRRKTLERGGTFGRYLPASNGTGHLVYINKGTLFAVPFDPDKLEVHGTPSPVLEEIAYNPGTGSAQFDFSRNGTLVYRGGGAAGGNLVTVQWTDASGKTQPLLANQASIGGRTCRGMASAWPWTTSRTSGCTKPGATP